MAKERKRAARKANSRIPTVPKWAWGVALVALLAVVAGVAVGTWGGSDVDGPTAVVATTAAPAAPAVASTIEELVTATTVVATTTTVPPTTLTSSTSTTTTAVSTTTTTPEAEQLEEQVIVGGFGETLRVTSRRDSCFSVPDCLVVSIAIEGWGTAHPGEFVCEFSSGRRFTFRFTQDEVDAACSTGDRPDTVVVEVGSLRSDPIVNPAA